MTIVSKSYLSLFIPQIDENLGGGEENPVLIPEKCPVCGAPTEQREGKKDKVSFLFCTNQDCSAKHSGRFERLVDRDALNVEGISKATLQEFLNQGFLKEPMDLFHLDQYKEEIITMDGFGEKSYENMIYSIEKARNTTFQRFFYSLGIPGVGKHVAKILNDYFEEELNPGYSKIDQLLGMLVSEDTGLLSLEGIGETIEKSMVDWFLNNRLDFIHLRSELHIQDEFVEKKEKKKGLQGLTFVITGNVEHYKNRNELKAEIESLGGKVAGSVSKKTSYLINNDIENSTSSKNLKAKSLGVPVITEEEYMKKFL